MLPSCCGHMLACIFQHWYCPSQGVGQTSLPQPTPSWMLSFFLSMRSPLLTSVSPEVSIIKSWQLPRSYSPAKSLSWTSKFIHSTVHQTFPFEYPRYLKGTGAKMNTSSSTCHKAHFYLPTLPVSENNATLHPAKKKTHKTFPLPLSWPLYLSIDLYHTLSELPLSLLCPPLEDVLYLLHCSSSHNQHCI